MRTIGVDTSTKGIWSQGFEVNPSTVTGDLGKFGNKYIGTTRGFLANVLIANSPQLLMSFLYLFYNNLLTRQLVVDELLRFTRDGGKKPLRVSSPVGMQRSSYFLSLPLKYSGPLLVCSVALHFLISQSIFLVQTSVFEPGSNSPRIETLDSSGRGYSHLGALLALALALALVLALFLMAFFRKYENTLPGLERMAHDCSAIQALCQRPDDDKNAHLFPISMGMVQDERSEEAECEGRLCFSTDIGLCQEPLPGRLYLLPVLASKGNTVTGKGILFWNYIVERATSIPRYLRSLKSHRATGRETDHPLLERDR